MHTALTILVLLLAAGVVGCAMVPVAAIAWVAAMPEPQRTRKFHRICLRYFLAALVLAALAGIVAVVR